jgi:plasmid maintenance system antidote protein VapI
LDVAATGPKSAAEVARVMGITTRRVEQIVKEFKRTHKALALARLGEE